MKLFSMTKTICGLLIILVSLSANVYAKSVWDPEKTGAVTESTLEITVHRSAQCSCCHKWIEHLEKHNFKITDNTTNEMALIKKELGLPRQLASCHTAVIDGYVIEGHVPAEDIIRLITEKPDNIAGLSVPAMPVGTPGMESQAGMGAERKDDFNVVAYDKQGNVSVYNSYKDY